ncbi:MAG: M24 family metallopeptidase [Steroidobacteraceae bacterium]
MIQESGRAASSAEFERRCRRIRAALNTAGMDALVAFAPAWRRENVRYLTDAPLRSSAAFVCLPLSGSAAAFLCSDTDVRSVQLAGFVSDARRIAYPDVSELADHILTHVNQGRAGVAGAEFVPSGVWQKLKALLPKVELVDAGALMDAVRLVKSDFELERMRCAGAICDKSWQAFQGACHPGAREYEIVAEVDSRLRGEGAEDNFMLIASGGSDVRGMTPPSDRRLEMGDLVRTELTPQFAGYWTQICRTAVLGRPSPKQRECFELFNEAVVAGLSVIKAGVTAHDVALAENDVFRRYGYGQYCSAEYTRVRGHCLGLYLDEVLVLEGVHTVLEKNTVLVVHPNTFTPLAGYFVLGDSVVVTDNGFESLLATPRELNVV